MQVLAVMALLAARMAADPDALAKASQAIVQGAPDSAVEVLEDYVAANPTSADGYRLLGVARSLLGQRSGALGALGRAAALAPRNPANHLALGQALAQFGEHEDAREAFQAAVSLDGELGPAHEGLALALAVAGELEQALQEFTAALGRSAGADARGRIHFLRGRALAQLERFDAAAEDFEASTELRPRFGPAYLEWGRSLTQGADPTLAESALREAATLMPDSFEAHFLYGSQLLRNSRPEAAVESLRRAAELEPSDRAAGYALGRALRAVGRSDEARRILAGLAEATSGRALEEARINEAGRLNNLGLEAEAAGDVALALRRYEEAVEIAPGNVDFQRNAALALGRLQRWSEAKARLREVLRLAPGDLDATKALYIALEHAPD